VSHFFSDVPSSRSVSALASLPLFSKGAHSDNMAPLKSQNPNPAPVTILQQGIDTLLFSVYGELREDVALCLEMAKEDAQASPSGAALAPLPPFDGVTPLVQEKGAPYYEWRAVSQDITVTIARPSKSKRPKAQIRVSSECLWRMGGGGQVAARLAEHYLRPLFLEDGYRVQVSQVHMATDYQGYDLCLDDRRGIVKRPRSIGEVPEHDGELTWWGVRSECQSVAAGRSNSIRINLYDKSREIEAKGKGWFVDLWERSKGYVPEQKTWRLEYQFGREFLRPYKVESLDDFLGAASGLWGYGVKWFSFRDPNPNDSHASRWPVAPWWAALASWRWGDDAPLSKVKQVRPRFVRIAEGGYGYITSAMALTGAESPYQALEVILRAVQSKKGEAGMMAAVGAKRLRYGGFTMAD
jgi:hypothetical protein